MKPGQALVIVLLVLAVTAAVGLSVVSRSVTEVNLSSNQDASSQSLSAAESGIEAVLADPETPAGTSGSVQTGARTSQYTVVSQNAVGGGTTLQVADGLYSGETATLFLREVDANGLPTGGLGYLGTGFRVCWGKVGLPGPLPALEVTIYSRFGGMDDVEHQGFNSATSNIAGFASPPTSGLTNGCTTSSLYRADITLPRGFILANFRLLFNTGSGHPVHVINSGSPLNLFPPQGQVHVVQGQTDQTSRRVSVTQTYPAPPGIFDNALFSGGNL